MFVLTYTDWNPFFSTMHSLTRTSLISVDALYELFQGVVQRLAGKA